MVQIDWGDVQPSERQRARIEARVEPLSLPGPVIGLRRRGNGYEAQLITQTPMAPAELRLQGDDLGSLVDRAMTLLSCVIEAAEKRER